MFSKELHNQLIRGSLESIAGIESALNVANAIVIAKEMHSNGWMTDDTYKKTLVKMLEKSGYRTDILEKA